MMKRPEERELCILRMADGAPVIAALDYDEGGVFVWHEGRVYRSRGPSNLSDLLVAHVTPVGDDSVEVRVPGSRVETWYRSARRLGGGREPGDVR